MDARTTAWRRDRAREETAGPKVLLTYEKSQPLPHFSSRIDVDTHVVCADIVRIEACRHDADGKDVVILMQVGHAGRPVCECRLWERRRKSVGRTADGPSI